VRHNRLSASVRTLQVPIVEADCAHLSYVKRKWRIVFIDDKCDRQSSSVAYCKLIEDIRIPTGQVGYDSLSTEDVVDHLESDLSRGSDFISTYSLQTQFFSSPTDDEPKNAVRPASDLVTFLPNGSNKKALSL